MSNEFQKMKTSGDLIFDRLRDNIRPDIGKHRRTKLKQALGSSAKGTLLDDAVWKQHAARLERQFVARWGALNKQEALERLRFWTVLDSVVPVNVDAIMGAVEQMFAHLDATCRQVRGLEVIGACEIEIVNLDRMRRFASEDDEARKLKVIEAMLPGGDGTNSGSMALVHFHGVIDFGQGAERKSEELGKASRKVWEQPYQVQIKRMYVTQSVRQNLKGIALYLTKGGNENLIYKIGFGYDSEDKINRQLVKSGKAKLEADYEGFENEYSLSLYEIEVLGKAIEQLMDRTGSKMRNGYLYRYGQQQKWV